jgi:hypothetical protein
MSSQAKGFILGVAVGFVICKVVTDAKNKAA